MLVNIPCMLEGKVRPSISGVEYLKNLSKSELKTPSRSSVFLLIFRLLVLSVTGRGVLESAAVIMDLSVFQF